MGKFCFVFLDSSNRMPYIERYINAAKYKYDVVLWDRSNLNDDCGAEVCYRLSHSLNKKGLAGKFQKLKGYIKFSKLARTVLTNNDYSGIFVFTPNSGMLIYRLLINKFKKRYILDIRDFWMEDKKWFYKIEEKMVNNSFYTIISSEAYKSFLPKGNYILTHNSQNLDIKTFEHFRNRIWLDKKQIVLACIGGIKHIEYDKKVIDYFANDNRFELRFIGRGYDALQEYCITQRISNVHCEGVFPMAETLSKYEDVDFILNMYGNHDKYLDYALSNKLYFSAQLGIPIIVCPDTYMATVSEKYGFGLSVNIDDPMDRDRVYMYYKGLDRHEFIKNCDLFMRDVEEDNERFNDAIKSFVQTCIEAR